mmetsp:Transcript_15419/g.33965  ORF Transcript_15419/g.33965 Transcript_15419/m.33965 type:complete len:253 (-) Transcript_15419:205-963(-)
MLGVQVQSCTVTHCLGRVDGIEVCGVVPRCLHRSCSLWCCAVVVLHYQGIDALLHARAAEVATHGHDSRHEGELLGQRRKTQHVAASKEERPDVEGRPVAVRRHEFHVPLHCLSHSVHEQGFWNLWHPEFLGPLLHSCGVQLRVHDADFTILAGEGLQAFEHRNAVMQGAAVDVEQDIGSWDKGANVPLAVCPSELHVAVHGPNLKAQGIPLRRKFLNTRPLEARRNVGVYLLSWHELLRGVKSRQLEVRFH